MRFIGKRRHASGFHAGPDRPRGAVCLPLLTSLLALLISAAAQAATAASRAAQPEGGAGTTVEQLVNSPLLPVLDYSKKTDHELTRIGARWDDLSKAEKNALLREVKLRMAQRKDADGVLVIRTQRRYGRVYSGGRYLKIETRVIRVRPSDPAANRGFGVGYERRSAERPPAESADEEDGRAEIEVPLVRVNGAPQ